MKKWIIVICWYTVEFIWKIPDPDLMSQRDHLLTLRLPMLKGKSNNSWQKRWRTWVSLDLYFAYHLEPRAAASQFKKACGHKVLDNSSETSSCYIYTSNSLSEQTQCCQTKWERKTVTTTTAATLMFQCLHHTLALEAGEGNWIALSNTQICNAHYCIESSCRCSSNSSPPWHQGGCSSALSVYASRDPPTSSCNSCRSECKQKENSQMGKEVYTAKQGFMKINLPRRLVNTQV